MKKTMNLIFIIVFLLCIVLPGINMEFGKNVKSEIDNAYLPELEFTGFEGFGTTVMTYIDKRIGFRQEALGLYQKINDYFFSIMEHPAYMYGENGYVYFKYADSMNNYQHLNLDEEYAQEFSEALLNFQNYAEDKGSTFMYFYIPDKETVYPEFYPKGINVCGNVSLADQITEALEEKGVCYYFAKDTMIEAKEQFLVNNVKYDAGHWNHNGAFVSIQHLYKLLQEDYPQLQVIQKEEFNIEYVLMESLQVSHFEIDEKVPVYSLKKSSAIDKTDEFRENNIIPYPEEYICHYVNSECKEQPKLLIFGDSYLAGYDDFFVNHFSQYTYIHRYNVCNQEFYEYYLQQVKPDIVIYENPERTHQIDLYQERSVYK